MSLTSARVINPRPDTETLSIALHRNAHPNVPYVCPIFIQGGAYPFWFQLLAGPAGATIGQLYGSTNYGVVTWPTPTSGTQTFTVRVFDQDGHTVDVTWTVTVGTSWIAFVDSTNGNDTTGNGTFGTPWKTYSKAISSVTGGKTICLRAGNYSLPSSAVSLSSTTHNNLIAYPGETVTIDCSTSTANGGCWVMNSTDHFITGIACSSGPTVANPRYFWGNSVCHRSHIYNVSFDNPPAGTAGNTTWDNQACWFLWDPGAQRNYNALVGCTFSRLPPGGNGFMAIDTYQCKYLLFENNTFTVPHPNQGEQHALFVKGAGNNEVTVRGNTWQQGWNTSLIALYLGMDGTTGGAPNNQEMCYNTLVQTTTSGWAAINAIINAAQNNPNPATVWSYRNTMWGVPMIAYQSVNVLTFSSESDVIVHDSTATGVNGKWLAVNGADANNVFRNPATIPNITYTITGTECQGGTTAGILDASYKLTGSFRTSFLGLRGAEITAIVPPSATPTPTASATPTPTPTRTVTPTNTITPTPTSSGMTFQLVSLVTGINNGLAMQDDGGTTIGTNPNTINWMSDASGSFARITYNKPGTFGLRWGFAQTGVHQIYIKYDVRRHFNNCSKQLKEYGWGQINGGSTSNTTFGCTMGGYAGTTYGIYYGDAATGSNDATVEMACSGYPTNNLPSIGFGGQFSRTPYPTQQITSNVTQDITGSVWQTIEIYARYNDANFNNGEFAVWVNGATNPSFYLTNLWNCSNGTQNRGGLGLGEFSSNSGFYEDYRNLYVSFDRPVGRGLNAVAPSFASNEPAGLTTIIDRQWNTSEASSFASALSGTDTYHMQWAAGAPAASPIIDTTTNLSTLIGKTIPPLPDGNSTCMAIHYPTNFTAAQTPFTIQYVGPVTLPVKKMYMCCWVLMPSNFSSSGNNIKWINFQNTSPKSNHIAMLCSFNNATDGRASWMVTQGTNNGSYGGQSSNATGALTSLPIPPPQGTGLGWWASNYDTWHYLEWYVQTESNPGVSFDGIFQGYFDGKLVNYWNNIRYNAPTGDSNGFNLVLFIPYYGGGGSNAPKDEYLVMGRMRVSGGN